MIVSTVLLVCLQAFVVTAQTPPGVITIPAVTEPLKVTYGTIDLSPAGKEVARNATAKAPTIGVPKSLISSKSKGLLIMIDPDVRSAGGNVTYLHWLSPNVDLSKEKAVVPTTGANFVKYFQPTPPRGDPHHRYTFLLYAQPDAFSIPAKYSNLQRKVFAFNVTDFAAAAGLGQPKAATFMKVKQDKR